MPMAAYPPSRHAPHTLRSAILRADLPPPFRHAQIRAKILSKDNVLINLTVDPAAMEAVTKEITAFVEKLPATPAAAPPPSAPT